MKKSTLSFLIAIIAVAIVGVVLNYAIPDDEAAGDDLPANVSVTVGDDTANSETIMESEGSTATEIPDELFFHDIFQRRENARAAGDIKAFNSLISARGIEAQKVARDNSTDEEFAQSLASGYQRTVELGVATLPLVDFQPGQETTLLIYEDLVTLPNDEERIMTRFVQFVLEDGEWKVDQDIIDGRGIQARELPEA